MKSVEMSREISRVKINEWWRRFGSKIGLNSNKITRENKCNIT